MSATIETNVITQNGNVNPEMQKGLKGEPVDNKVVSVVEPFVQYKFRNKTTLEQPFKEKNVYRVMKARVANSDDVKLLEFNKKARYSSRNAMSAVKKANCRIMKLNDLPIETPIWILMMCTKLTKNKKTDRVVEAKTFFPVVVMRVKSAKPKCCYNYSDTDRETKKSWLTEMKEFQKTIGQGDGKTSMIRRYRAEDNSIKEYTAEEAAATTEVFDPKTYQKEKRTIVHGMEDVGFRFEVPEQGYFLDLHDGVFQRKANKETEEVQRIEPLKDEKTSQVQARNFHFDTKRINYPDDAPELKRILDVEGECIEQNTLPLKQLVRDSRAKQREKELALKQKEKAKKQKELEKKQKQKKAETEKLQRQAAKLKKQQADLKEKQKAKQLKEKALKEKEKEKAKQIKEAKDLQKSKKAKELELKASKQAKEAKTSDKEEKTKPRTQKRSRKEEEKEAVSEDTASTKRKSKKSKVEEPSKSNE